MIDQREENRIRSRLRMGNSPKRIALDYPESQGMLTAIEEIKARMLGTTVRPIMDVPVTVPHLHKAYWTDDLPRNVGKLIRECCEHCGCDIERFRDGNLGYETRKMVAFALRHRWAMNYNQIANVLGASEETASKWVASYSGPLPVTVPPLPEVDKTVLPALERFAGQYKTTSWAIVNGGSLYGVAVEARRHFIFHLYFELAWRPVEIAKIVQMAPPHTTRAALKHIECNCGDVEHWKEVRLQKQLALKKRKSRKRSQCHA